MQRHIYKYYRGKTSDLKMCVKKQSVVLQMRSAALCFRHKKRKISNMHKNVFICKKASK